MLKKPLSVLSAIRTLVEERLNVWNAEIRYTQDVEATKLGSFMIQIQILQS